MPYIGPLNLDCVPLMVSKGFVFQTLRGREPPIQHMHVDAPSVGPLADAVLYSLDVPSEKLLIASFDGDSATYFKATFGSPSRIIRCTMMSALKTMVHVESRNRFCSALNISATPASPA